MAAFDPALAFIRHCDVAADPVPTRPGRYLCTGCGVEFVPRAATDDSGTDTGSTSSARRRSPTLPGVRTT